MSEHWRRPFPSCIVICIKFCFIYIYIYIWGNVILTLRCVWVWFSVDFPVFGIFFLILYVTLILYTRVEQMHISWSNVTEHVCVCVLCDILVCMLVHTHTHTCACVDQKVKNPPYFQLQNVSLIVTLIDWEGFLRLAWI